MAGEREADPLGRFALAAGQRRQVQRVLEVLREDEHAPSSVREPRRALKLHVADSLAALELEAVAAPRRLADLGSGAGFPGAPLAIALPHAHVTLLDSNRRRVEFMRRLCAAAQIGNASVICTRVEEWREGLSSSDVALARALAPQPVVLEYAAPLLRVGGALVDWRGRRDAGAERAAARAAAELGMERVEVRRVPASPGAENHHLHVFVKKRQTPARFPRRAGVARKRPLGI